MLIAHMADIHLGLRQYGLLWREKDFYDRFREAIEQAVREGVDAILISGDMFDRARPPIQALKVAIEVLNLPTSKGIPVYAVLGEHDLPKIRDIPPQFILPNLKILGTSSTPSVDRIVVDGHEWFIAGISHIPPTSKGLRSLKEKLKEIEGKVRKRSVLMMHQNIVNVFPLESGLELSDMPQCFQYVAMGHIHRRWKSKGKPLIAYPGSIEIVRSDEIEEWKKNGKGFYLVDLSSDEPLLQNVDLEVTPQLTIDTKYPNHRRDAVLGYQEIPKKRRGILHINVCIPQGIKADPASEVVAALRSVDREGRVHLRISTYPCSSEAVSSGKAFLSQHLLREEDIIAELIGGEKPLPEAREMAEIIISMKKAISEGGEQSSLDPFIDKLLSYRSFWRGKIRLPPLLELEKALEGLDSGLETESRNKPVTRGLEASQKRGLEEFFRVKG